MMSNVQSIHQAIYKELGEPMLRMCAEIPTNHSNESCATANPTSLNPNPLVKVLLRTRILLKQDAYQCQGGNIITWCEPFHVQQQQQQGKKEVKSQIGGVDLALSFQDNAGCKDIWRHILDVQLRAKELSHFWTRGGRTGAALNMASGNVSNHASKSPSVDVNAPTQVNSVGQGSSSHHETQTTLHHHNHQPLSPEKPHHAHVHQPLSPHSPDHDALEDRQLSMVTLPKHPPLWQGHHHGNNNHQSNSSQNQLRQQHLGQQNRDNGKEEAQLNESYEGESASPGMAHGSDSTSSHHNRNECNGESIQRAPSPLSLYSDMKSCSTNNSNSMTFESPISPAQLPNPPGWSDLKDICTLIEDCQMQQREDLLIFLSQSDCAYLKTLLGLFHSAPEEELDRDNLGMLAVCIRLILLMNDPEIIEYVTNDVNTFDSVCGVLEYTPELCEKANYRQFIRERAKFRTVVKMEDEELVSYIHRLFRVNYLKDYLLRPTMEESCLSTLASLAQFTQSDIIKGVMHTMPHQNDQNNPNKVGESYFAKVLRVLGTEIKVIRKIQFDGSDKSEEAANLALDEQKPSSDTDMQPETNNRTIWSQHVVPQDSSLQSRLVRRKGCISFLRELFNMSRTSLQQQEKEEFIPMCISTSVHLADRRVANQVSDDSSKEALADDPPHQVNLLFLLGTILSDPNADSNERSSALEILSVITIHDPAIIRRHCLESSRSQSDEKVPILRPEPNDLKQIIFLCPSDDLIQSLLFVMSTETDAGVLLQTSEIIRIILDTEMMGEQSASDSNSQLNNQNEHSSNGQTWNPLHDNNAGGLESSEQNRFLSMFYERYMQWLFSPFLYKILVPKVAFPLNSSIKTMIDTQQSFRRGNSSFEIALRPIPWCSIRLSFTFEILAFCVRAHVYRMKLFVLRTRLLSSTLKLLSPKPTASSSDDRCLKLASLK